MDPLRYNALVTRLETLARANPGALRRRALGLIALGYGYVLAILLAIFGTLAAVVWLMVSAGKGAALFKVVIALLVVGWLILKSLWVRTEPPPGVVLPKGGAPVLDTRVEEIRSALRAPRADAVLLTNDFNASVTQVPRLGIFGWPRTYLSLGLPLMYGLDQRQLDAVLAHEFAHLSGAHPKMGLWVYRMSRTWQQLLAHLEEARSWGSRLFDWFVRWYQPRLQAHGFVMSRRDEYEADADAARVTSADAMAAALVALEIRGRALNERFWPQLWKRAEIDHTPPERSWSTVPALLRDDVPQPLRLEWLGKALGRRALDDDTHPSLAERLAALGVLSPHAAQAEQLAERMLPPLARSAAEHYLGDVASELLVSFEREWREGVAESWREHHESLKARRARASELIARDEAGPPLDADEVWELACTVAELEDERAAIPYLRRTVDATPGNAVAHFMLGRALIAGGDEAGVERLRTAMSLDQEAVPASTELLRQFFADRGERELIEEIQVDQYAYAEMMRLAAAERADVGRKDTLVAPELPEEDLERLRSVAASHARVKELYVARKLTEHRKDQPMYVVVAVPRWWRVGSWGSADQELARRILDDIVLSGTAHVLVIVMSGSAAWLLKRMKKVAGSLVYSRGADRRAPLAVEPEPRA